MEKLCPTCHETKPETAFYRDRHRPDGYAYSCKHCQNTPERRAKRLAAKKRSYAKHRASIIQRASVYRETHLERRRDIEQRSYHKHRLQRKAYHAQRYLHHKERLLQASRRWKTSRHEYVLAQARLYRRAHLARYAEHAAHRRARKLHAPVVEQIDRAAIIARDRSLCHICGLSVSHADMSLDHLIPLAVGGEHSARNLAVAHILCNKKRGKGYLPAQLRLW